jgi:hypothetical protein
MDNQSAVEYWEKFAMHAFDNTESCAFTTCILLSPTNRPVPCTFCFSIKRDIFDLPSVIVGNVSIACVEWLLHLCVFLDPTWSNIVPEQFLPILSWRILLHHHFACILSLCSYFSCCCTCIPNPIKIGELYGLFFCRRRCIGLVMANVPLAGSHWTPLCLDLTKSWMVSHQSRTTCGFLGIDTRSDAFRSPHKKMFRSNLSRPYPRHIVALKRRKS